MSSTEQVCLDLERARDLLLKPAAEGLHTVEAELRAAIETLTAVRASLENGAAVSQSKPRKETLDRIRITGEQIGKLLHQAGGIQLEWARHLLSTGGYTALGAETPLPAVGRLLVEG